MQTLILALIATSLTVIDAQFVPRINLPTMDGSVLVGTKITLNGGPTSQPNNALQLTNVNGNTQNVNFLHCFFFFLSRVMLKRVAFFEK
jgi:hypothetical protein